MQEAVPIVFLGGEAGTVQGGMKNNNRRKNSKAPEKDLNFKDVAEEVLSEEEGKISEGTVFSNGKEEPKRLDETDDEKEKTLTFDSYLGTFTYISHTKESAQSTVEYTAGELDVEIDGDEKLKVVVREEGSEKKNKGEKTAKNLDGTFLGEKDKVDGVAEKEGNTSQVSEEGDVSKIVESLSTGEVPEIKNDLSQPTEIKTKNPDHIKKAPKTTKVPDRVIPENLSVENNQSKKSETVLKKNINKGSVPSNISAQLSVKTQKNIEKKITQPSTELDKKPALTDSNTPLEELIFQEKLNTSEKKAKQSDVPKKIKPNTKAIVSENGLNASLNKNVRGVSTHKGVFVPIKEDSKDYSVAKKLEISPSILLAKHKKNVVENKVSKKNQAPQTLFTNILNKEALTQDNSIESLPKFPMESFPKTLESNVVRQTTSRIFGMLNRGEQQMDFQLDPPALGKLNLRVVSKGQNLYTVIQTESDAAKQILNKNHEMLRASLEQSGFSLEKFSVNVGGGNQQTFNRNLGTKAKKQKRKTGVSDKDVRLTKKVENRRLSVGSLDLSI